MMLMPTMKLMFKIALHHFSDVNLTYCSLIFCAVHNPFVNMPFCDDLSLPSPFSYFSLVSQDKNSLKLGGRW